MSDHTPRSSRPPPPEVPAVVHAGVRYEQDLQSWSHGGTQSGGYLVAYDADTGRRLWMLAVYELASQEPAGVSAPGRYFRSLRLEAGGAALEIEDEAGDRYRVVLATRSVERLPRRGADAPTEAFYDRHAGDIAAGCEAARSAISQWFGRAFDRGARVLDVGCGSGRDLAVLCAAGCEAYGVEPNATLRELAVRRHPELAGRIAAGGLPHLGVPFAGAFQGVLCSAVLMHVPAADLAAALQALQSLVAGGGRLLLSVPSIAPGRLVDGRDADARLFANHDPAELQQLLERHGLRLVERRDDAQGVPESGTAWSVMLFERAG